MYNRRQTVLPNGIEYQDISCISPETITKSVLEYFGVTIDEIRERNRKIEILIPRHFLHYFLTINDRSLREITDLTRYDHANIVNSRNKIEDLIFVDRQFRVKAYAIAQFIITNHKNNKYEQR